MRPPGTIADWRRVRNAPTSSCDAKCSRRLETKIPSKYAFGKVYVTRVADDDLDGVGNVGVLVVHCVDDPAFRSRNRVDELPPSSSWIKHPIRFAEPAVHRVGDLIPDGLAR